MAETRKQEARALSADEMELVSKSHHPELQELPDDELRGLVKLVRERRNKARDEANRRRRELRGKAKPKGSEPSRSDAGSKLKVSVLAMANRRLNSEIERRRKMGARLSLVENAQNALAMKREAEEPRGKDFNSRRAHQGMRNVPSRKPEDLIRPMELGRQRQAAKVAQAKRDSRQA